LYPSEISGGMQKRVAIARAIALNPQYLFCDEPNSGLDPKTAKIIDKLIQDLTYEFNMTTIVNTHDLNSIVEIGDQILFIHKGEKKWEGNKDNVLKSKCPELEDFMFSSSILRKFNNTR
ncbi:MAG TPA: ATP-binding cassette domain-containing protein, partial [Bacteroidales bacterium]|nr:ATP-binding cassette domain-containing protein [Bacteroidales bacterium]